MTHRILWTALAALALAASPANLPARTDTFLETNQDQFDEGEFDGMVSTSLGGLRLGRALDDLLAETPGVDYVARCARAPDGALYAVTGGSGRIYRVADAKVTLYATLEDPYLFSVVAEENGDLYVGSGGTAGRIWHVAPPKGDEKEPQAEVLFEDEAVKYVWDLAWMADGALAAATGDQGQLLRVQPDGKHSVLIDSEDDHVLCLTVGPDGTLYAGTDGEAMVYRWTDGKAFVLYDAGESEVTALATDADGNLYVGTSSGRAGRAAGVSPRPQPPQTNGNGNGNNDAAPAASDNDPSDERNNEPPDAEAPDASDADTEASDAEEETPDAEPAGTPIAEARKLAHTVQAARKTSGGGPGKGGAAAGASVYRITPDGLATPLFDADEGLLLALAVHADRLLVGTGDPGRIYEVGLANDGEEQACLATVDPKQVMALVVPEAGRPIVATAGPGRLYALSEGHARRGTYTSQVYDVGGSARWGALQWRGRTPDGTKVQLATRTGNVGDPEKGLWSDWSKGLSKPSGKVTSPPARYIQFRVAMETNNPDRTPLLEQFEAAYLRANEPPRVVAISEIAYGDKQNRAQAIQRFRQAMRKRASGNNRHGRPPRPPAPKGSQPIRVFQWQAEDPNGDTLRYRLDFRGQGEKRWITLEDDLTRPEYAWNTNTVADGWYEIRVVASDRMDHPADLALRDERVSDPVLIDNTAPILENVKAKLEKGDENEGPHAVVTFTARDATSRLTEAAYTVDADDDWQTIAPQDRLFDTPRETFRFVTDVLGPGPHRIGIRAVDEANNRGHAAVTVVVEE